MGRSTKMTPAPSHKVSVKKSTAGKKASSKKFSVFTVGAILLSVLLVAVCYWCLASGIRAGAGSMWSSYNAAYRSERDAAYQALYAAAFDRAEKNYHVSNTAVISIGDLEQVSRLEVLRANDVEFITEDKDDNSGNVTAWLEVTGEGDFVIDLQAAEFLIDNERLLVTVRLPNPELTNVNICWTWRMTCGIKFLWAASSPASVWPEGSSGS